MKDNKQEQDDQTFDIAAIRSVARYLHYLRTLTIVRHLVPVIIASQQHRGANLAYLEGDQSYKEKVAELQNQIDYRLTTLQLINQELSKPVLKPEVIQLLQEWHNVKSWSNGPALENFNLHSHFVEQLMQLVWRVTERSNYFFMDPALPGSTSGQFPEHELSNGGLLIRFILNETPQLIELIAKIRGIATHASVLGVCDADHASMLGYLLTQLNQKKERFRDLSKQLQQYAIRDLPQLMDIQMQDSKIVQLAQIVKDQIIQSDRIQLGSQDIFTMATSIINSQTEVVYQGLDYIQNRMHRQFEGYHEIS